MQNNTNPCLCVCVCVIRSRTFHFWCYFYLQCKIISFLDKSTQIASGVNKFTDFMAQKTHFGERDTSLDGIQVMI